MGGTPILAKMTPETLDTLRSTIRDVPDFPNPGILFKDITPILADHRLLRLAIDGMIEQSGVTQVDKVVGIDARGFIFGSLIADRLGAGFVPVRKKGKLPYKTHGIDYDLEYGTAHIEIHQDAIRPGETVLIADDLLVTGGTAAAALSLIQKLDADILGSLFFIELAFLNGRERLSTDSPIHALITY